VVVVVATIGPMVQTHDDPVHAVRRAAPVDGEPVHMLPAAAYTTDEVLSWELRHLLAGGWTCLGRVDELLPTGGDRPVTQRALSVGDVAVVLVRSDGPRLFANTCRHRGHELLPPGEATHRRSIVCPYHAWSYDLDDRFHRDEHGLVELPVRVWEGWVFGHALHPLGSPDVPSFEGHLGALADIVAPHAPGRLVLADRHTYEVLANWKVLSENYHECYHCPLIRTELCQVSPPDSGANYDLPGGWVGGSMDLRDGMQTMSSTELVASPLPGVDPARVEYLHLLPNLLISAHADYVMTRRLVPLAPGRTWVECSWLVLPPEDGSAADVPGAVGFWDVTNRQDWAACESVQRGLASRTSGPGRSRPTRTPWHGSCRWSAELTSPATSEPGGPSTLDGTMERWKALQSRPGSPATSGSGGRRAPRGSRTCSPPTRRTFPLPGPGPWKGSRRSPSSGTPNETARTSRSRWPARWWRSTV
jgi:Rieske 2Fe-2S family protein